MAECDDFAFLPQQQTYHRVSIMNMVIQSRKTNSQKSSRGKANKEDEITILMSNITTLFKKCV